ncbi:MAG: hypothetical protein WA777_16335 [Rhodanobacter sp.]
MWNFVRQIRKIKKTNQRKSYNPRLTSSANFFPMTGVQQMTTAPPYERCNNASLKLLLVAAYSVDRSDRLLSPVGNNAYSTLFSVIPASLAVLRVAAELEPDAEKLMTWYEKVCIAELGQQTASKLVSCGRAETVIIFLRSIQSGERG